MDILGPDRGKMTIYGSDFQQVNLTPNGAVSPTVIEATSSSVHKPVMFDLASDSDCIPDTDIAREKEGL